jgi:hypothetical protein
LRSRASLLISPHQNDEKEMQQKHTTLLLIPGGSELALPQNAQRFKEAVFYGLEKKTLRVMMLADDPLIHEDDLRVMRTYKNILLIESDNIVCEEDAYYEARQLLTDNHLPSVATSGFDFQVVKMEPVGVVYEDFEILDYK